MKLYERMGIDPNTVDGITEILGLRCDVIEKSTSKTCNKYRGNCPRCKAERLFAEVPTKKVPRMETIHTVEELENAGKIFEETICLDCKGCRYNEPVTNTYECFIKYLSEEIEVAINE